MVATIVPGVHVLSLSGLIEQMTSLPFFLPSFIRSIVHGRGAEVAKYPGKTN